MFNFSHFQLGESCENVIALLRKLKITRLHKPQGDFSTAPTHFDHDKSPEVIVMIVIEQAQFLPTVLYLSPWMQSAAFTLACVYVYVCVRVRVRLCVCVSARDSVSLFAPLWQLADVLVTVSDSVSVWECYCVRGIMKSSQHALQRGSTVKPWRVSGAVVAEPGAVITAALRQHCAS